MDNLETKAVELLTKLEQLAPEAMDTMIEVLRITAVSNIVMAVIGILASIFIISKMRDIFKIYEEIPSKYDAFVDIGLAIGGGTAVILMVIGAFTLFNPWTYIALYNPELVLARQMLGL